MLKLYKLCAFILTIALWHSYASKADTVDIVDTNERVIFCYWGTWAHYRQGNGKFQVSNIDPQLCTHLGYTFFGITEEGTIKSLDKWLDNDLGNIRKAIELKKKNPNLKVMASVGGWNEGSSKYSAMAATATKRAKFIASVVQFLRQHGFDGIDLDWEYPAQRGGQAVDHVNFITLLRELKAALNPHHLLLSTAVAAAEPSAKISYDINGMAQYVDLINVMTYDFHGSWERVLGFNAPLKGTGPNSVEAAIEYWLKEGAPANKLLLGIPIYGRTFALADKSKIRPGDPNNGPGAAGPYTQTAGFLGYNEICENFHAGGWTQQWDDAQLVPYAHKDNQWFSYDDKRSIEQKINFLKSHNLRGAIVWSIETDDFRGVCGEPFTLLKVVHNTIKTDEKIQDSSDSIKTPSIEKVHIFGPPVTGAPTKDELDFNNNQDQLSFVLLNDI